MRWVAVAVVVLAGCGGQEAATVGGESGACAAAVVYNHGLYVRAEKRRPALKGRLDGGFVPACNDHNGATGSDQPVVLRRIAGVSPADAVYSRKPFPGVYRRTGSLP